MVMIHGDDPNSLARHTGFELYLFGHAVGGIAVFSIILSGGQNDKRNLHCRRREGCRENHSLSGAFEQVQGGTS